MNKLTKEDCLKAHDNLCKALTKTDYVECVKGYTYQTMEDELEMLYQLINEHFNNSLNFKHFKLHSDSTLKRLKKDELIDYIHILYENWGSADSFNENLSNYNQILTSELKKFDNQPLKFEELENLKEQAIWDKKEKRYILFESARHNYVNYYGTLSTIYGIPFEENRFYRYEVKEDE